MKILIKILPVRSQLGNLGVLSFLFLDPFHFEIEPLLKCSTLLGGRHVVWLVGQFFGFFFPEIIVSCLQFYEDIFEKELLKLLLTPFPGQSAL